MSYSAFSGLNSGNAGIKKTVRQANDFTVGDVVRLDGANYVRAQANSAINAEVVGVVENVGASQFTVVFAGEVQLGTIETVSGTPYFLRSDAAGSVDPTPPLNTGTIKKTVYIGVGSNRAIVVNYLGLLNGFEGGDQVSLTGVSPVGQIIPFAGSVNNTGSIPSGWLLCDGAFFSSSDYPELSLMVGDIYGQRSGANYRLPDLRGRTPVGANQNTAVTEANPLFNERIIGSMAGLEEVTLSTSEMPNHTHGASYVAFLDDAADNIANSLDPNHWYGPGTNDDNNPAGQSPATYKQIDSSGPIVGNDWAQWEYGTDDHNYGKMAIPSTVNGEGGGGAHTNMQPFLVTNWLIRADSRVSAAILTVNVQDMADVDSSKAYTEQSGGVLMYNAANDLVSPLNAKGGNDKFIINPVSDSDRNVIINGNMDIWQRGTSFATETDGWNFTADRWFQSQNAAYPAQGILSRKTDTPFSAGLGNVPCSYALSYKNNTAATTFAVGDYSMIGHIVEGYNYASLWSAGYMTLSFWVRAALPGIRNVSFRNNNWTRSYVSEYNITTANTWEWKTITVPIDSNNHTMWHFQDSVGIRVEWQIGKSGTNYQTTTPNQWNSGNAIGTASAVNSMSTVADGILEITQVQLEAGRIATPIQPRRIQDELTMCERYYEKSYDLNTVPGTPSYAGSIHSNDWVVSNTAHINASFRTRKRRTPKVEIYNPNTGSKNSVYMLHRESGTSTHWGVASVSRGTTNIHRIERNSGNWVSGYKNKLNFQYVAESELLGANS
jgi:microcystin-dependent protein